MSDKEVDMVNSPLTEKQLSQFWSKVLKTDNCWEWIGSINEKRGGYGQIMWKRKLRKAHHIIMEIIGVEIGDMFVLHSCDNPSCVNPDHLFLGTH